MIAIAYAADNSISIYQDGVLQTSYTQGTLQSYNNNVNFLLGLRHLPIASGKYFNGSIDEARVYGTALSATDIAALAVAGPNSLSAAPNGLLPPSTAVQMASGARFDLNGNSQTIASLSGALGSVVTNSASSTAALQVSMSGGVATFAGSIQNAVGSISLSLNGSGILVLSGTNTFAGGTAVSAGTLVLASAYSVPDGSSLTIGAGAPFAQSEAIVPQTAIEYSAVPEPGTFALFAVFSGIVVFLHNRSRHFLRHLQ
jgi:autotransporter-associated beta strand protein